METYSIYAIKYAGPFTSSGAFLMWRKEWDKTVERCYYLWCARSEKETVIVDAGIPPELAKQKNLGGYVNPAEVLSRIGVAAEEVQHLILTHIHWDHSSGVTLFPKAKIYVQEAEFNFNAKDPIAQRGPFSETADEKSRRFIASLEGSERLVLLKGDQTVLPGIECLLAPGHTVALQAVAVNTAKGTAILGSDCAHTFRNYREDWPSCLIVDLVGWMKSYDKLRSRASSPDLLFPGHDKLMSTEYPEVAKDVTRLV
ncbi:MAG TPA: N-acyl homoserine lactonase family protein [Thermodesulfobacteriota bacterium]|nr:N-acyl homoserine lactonase family protein [Thermodesulfobacteriota bacterium]